MSRANIDIFIFFLILLNLSCVNSSRVYITFDGERYHIEENKHDPVRPDGSDEGKDEVKELSVPLAPLTHSSKPVAWATFENAINQTGWAYLEVYTSDYYNDSMQAYAAGLAEGYITRDLISMHWMNTYEGYCKTPLTSYCQKLQQFLQDNLSWMTEQLAKNEAYWHHVGLILDQLSGLTDGYKNQPGHPSHQIDVTGLLLLQISGDLEDLSEVLTGERITSPVGGHGHCSALIKVLSGNSDLYVAQDTWDGLNSMLRIQKKYDFSWHLTADPNSEMITGKEMTFSSYPGLLSSGDDFYVISSGLVTQETTIGNSNAARWKFVQPQLSVLEGTRAMVANRLASTGAEWVNLFSMYNSGTYNNQWMVVNYNIFKPGQPLSDGLFYVLEQIPGMIVKEDMTAFLRENSYWPSFNIASFPKIFNASGQWDSVNKYGDWFTWEKSPRAQIFRRDHSSVTDLDSMTKIMRYNNFRNDPLSRCNCTPPYSGENAISARCDLNPANGTYPFSALGHRNHAGTDMKLTSSELMKSLQFKAISGPTSDDLPPFQWSRSDYKDSVSHVGHPDLWQFDAVIHKWGAM